MDQKEIDILDKLQADENNGRGVLCVQAIIAYLRAGRDAEAGAIRQWDGDKTVSYWRVEEQLTKMFGCRTHLRHNCKNWLCAPRGRAR